jgi:hypothetical protein
MAAVCMLLDEEADVVDRVATVARPPPPGTDRAP